MQITTYKQAITYLHSHIPGDAKQVFAGGKGLDRVRSLLTLLDNPQDKVKVVHIAGTSGKGSTAYILSNLLRSQNFNVGLTVSPHLLDIRERIQINNALISKKSFVKNLNEIAEKVKEVDENKYGRLTYFELLTVLAFYTFYKEQVDYAVVETGLGGLMDATNVINSQDKICVITKIGLDHTHILGKKLTDIALQKAGIIQKDNIVVVTWQRKEIQEVFKKVSKEKKAQIYILDKSTIKEKVLTPTRTSFKYSDHNHYRRIEISLIGEHQIENTVVALRTFIIISKRDFFTINWKRAESVLCNLSFPGRMDFIEINGSNLILDGAHNRQKMDSLVKTLAKIYPHKKLVFLLAFKQGKDYKQMIKKVIPIASEIVLTQFGDLSQDLPHSSQNIASMQHFLEKKNYTKTVTFSKSKAALWYCLNKKEDVVITGSLYFMADIYTLLK